MGGISRRSRRARVHHRGRHGRPGRHGQLRGSAHLAEAARRHPRLHGHATRSPASPIWWAPFRQRARSRMNELNSAAVALDVDTIDQRACAGRRTARRRRRVQDRQPAVHEPRAGIRRGARVARRSRLPRSEVPRHPEHRRRRGGRRHAARRVDGQRACVGRPRDDEGRARSGRRRSRAPVAPGSRS